MRVSRGVTVASGKGERTLYTRFDRKCVLTARGDNWPHVMTRV